MNDNLIGAYYIPSKKAMGFLGHAFGTEFVRPFLFGKVTHPCNVIALTGYAGSGKSPLIKHIGRGLKIYNSGPFFSESPPMARPPTKSARIKDLYFRWTDFGRYVYAHNNNFREDGVLINNMRAAMFSRCEMDLRQMDLPGVEILENSSVPHMRQATALIHIVDLTDLPQSRFYFRTIGRWLRDDAANPDSPTDRDLKGMLIPLLDTTERMIEARRESPVRPRTRIVTIAAIPRHDGISAAFERFNNAVRHLVIS